MDKINIALVGKITESYDSYINVKESVLYAAAYLDIEISITWVNSSKVNESNINKTFKSANGMILLGGFGETGTEGMVLAAQFARENDIPLLGICLGMQIITIEFARNVLGYKAATSEEFNKDTLYPVVRKIPSLKEGMRLGTYNVDIAKDSLAYKTYQQEEVEERFRHGYEFNLEYKEQYISNGMCISGTLKDTSSVEIIEMPSKKYFIGVQFHPEYRSDPLNPHPLFIGLLKALIK